MIGITEASASAKLERLLRFHDESHVNLLIVTIIELADNENALVAEMHLGAVRASWSGRIDFRRHDGNNHRGA
jgi:hypothetical protein